MRVSHTYYKSRSTPRSALFERGMASTERSTHAEANETEEMHVLPSGDLETVNAELAATKAKLTEASLALIDKEEKKTEILLEAKKAENAIIDKHCGELRGVLSVLKSVREQLEKSEKASNDMKVCLANESRCSSHYKNVLATLLEDTKKLGQHQSITDDIKELLANLSAQIEDAMKTSSPETAAAAASDGSQDTKICEKILTDMTKHVICPITFEFMLDPVILPGGQTVSRKALTQTLNNHATSVRAGSNIMKSKIRHLLTNEVMPYSLMAASPPNFTLRALAQDLHKFVQPEDMPSATDPATDQHTSSTHSTLGPVRNRRALHRSTTCVQAPRRRPQAPAQQIVHAQFAPAQQIVHARFTQAQVQQQVAQQQPVHQQVAQQQPVYQQVAQQQPVYQQTNTAGFFLHKCQIGLSFHKLAPAGTVLQHVSRVNDLDEDGFDKHELRLAMMASAGHVIFMEKPDGEL